MIQMNVMYLYKKKRKELVITLLSLDPCRTGDLLVFLKFYKVFLIVVNIYIVT